MQNESSLNFKTDEKNNCEILNLIRNILDNIHVSSIYVELIFQFIISHCDDKKLPTVLFAIYHVLNKHQVTITMRELAAISTISTKQMNKVQKHNQNINLTYVDLMEKYARLLDLSYPIRLQMKEKILQAPNSGHNPCSLVAAVIYSVCKEQQLGISMKTIASLMQVSCISIQRYLKVLIKNDYP